jgi:PAT family beta-lactamase induction signal transducer AmpG
MLDLSKYRYLKFILFGSLYFSEGLQFSICTPLIIIYLPKIGISIDTTTMVSGLAASPFILKFLMGPIIDFFIKYGRKPFIIIGGTIGGLFLILLAGIDPLDSVILFTIVLFISHVGVVFLDVSADAWAIQISEPHERGRVNSAMFSGLFAGLAFGTALLPFIGATYNYQLAFIISGLIIFLTIILPLAIKEIKIAKIRPKIAKLLYFEFKRKNTLIIAFYGLVSSITFGLLLLIMPHYMRDVLNLTETQTGLLSLTSPIFTIIGAVVGGVMADKIGRKITLYIFLIGTLIFTSLLITANSWQILAILYSIIGLLQGVIVYSALCALFMDVTNPKIGATQFSILTSMANFGEIGLGMFGGALVLILGYHRFFLYAALIAVPAILILHFVEEKKYY